MKKKKIANNTDNNIALVASIAAPGGGLTLWQILGNIQVADIGISCIIILAIFLLTGLTLIGIKYHTIMPARIFSHVVHNKVMRIIFVYGLRLLIGGIIGTSISFLVFSYQQKKDSELLVNGLYTEQKYIKNDSHGINDYFNGNYSVAKDSLIAYSNTDPVAAYYYGVMLYDGLYADKRINRDDWIKYVWFSANKYYYRALFLLEDHYAITNQQDSMAYYANKIVGLMQYTKGDIKKDTMIRTQYNKWVELYNNSFSRLQYYYTFINPDMNKRERIIKKHWKLLDNYQDIKKELKVELSIGNAWMLHILGKRKNAEFRMKWLTIKNPQRPIVHIEYAKMLLEKPGINERSDVVFGYEKRIKQAEQHLIKALKLSSKLKDTQCQMRASRLLSDLYLSVNYIPESAEMDHLAVSYEIQQYYEGIIGK